MIDQIISAGMIAVGGVSIFAIVRSKVETHHKILYSERGELQFHTKTECKERHESDLKTIHLEIGMIQKDIHQLSASIEKLIKKMESFDDYHRP